MQPTVWSLRNFCITWNSFREINYKVNSLLKKLFSRKFFKNSWYKNFVKPQCGSTVWNCNFSLTLFSHKFRENIVFTKEITKYLIWRNLLQWGEERELLVFSLCKVKTLLSRIFCQNCERVNFRNFHTVCFMVLFCTTLAQCGKMKN